MLTEDPGADGRSHAYPPTKPAPTITPPRATTASAHGTASHRSRGGPCRAPARTAQPPTPRSMLPSHAHRCWIGTLARASQRGPETAGDRHQCRHAVRPLPTTGATCAPAPRRCRRRPVEVNRSNPGEVGPRCLPADIATQRRTSRYGNGIGSRDADQVPTVSSRPVHAASRRTIATRRSGPMSSAPYSISAANHATLRATTGAAGSSLLQGPRSARGTTATPSGRR